MGNFVPQGVSYLFVQAWLVVRMHQQRPFEKCNPVWKQAFPPLALAERNPLVQPEERLVLSEFQLVPLLHARLVGKQDGHVLHPVAVYLRQAIKSLIYEFLEVFIGYIVHYTNYSRLPVPSLPVLLSLSNILAKSIKVLTYMFI